VEAGRWNISVGAEFPNMDNEGGVRGAAYIRTRFNWC
jgi:hypothetical protein